MKVPIARSKTLPRARGPTSSSTLLYGLCLSERREFLEGFSEFLVKEWADLFVGVDEGQLKEMAKCFSFENCHKRDGLDNILTAQTARVLRSKG
jgi:hypothetical protein